jgi:hypothetical protein
MRFLYKVIDDLDICAAEAAGTPIGHVLEALVVGEPGTQPNLANGYSIGGVAVRLRMLLTPVLHAMTPRGELTYIDEDMQRRE